MTFKRKICSVVFIAALFALIGVIWDENLTFTAVKNLLCLAAVFAAAKIGRLTERIENE